jgi:hypothetical protein
VSGIASSRFRCALRRARFCGHIDPSGAELE